MGRLAVGQVDMRAGGHLIGTAVAGAGWAAGRMTKAASTNIRPICRYEMIES